MITIALKEKTVEVSSLNTAVKKDKQENIIAHQLWATKKQDGASLVIYESEVEENVTQLKSAIDKAIELGEYLFDMKGLM